jgi:hypothetical protein
LAHGVRHFAFLVRVDPGFTADKEIKAETIDQLSRLLGEPAGRYERVPAGVSSIARPGDALAELPQER